MDSSTYRELRRRAARLVRNAADAEDLVQRALVAALEAGRDDPAWLHGVMRNLAAMDARTAVRRRAREQAVATRDDEAADLRAPPVAEPPLHTLLGRMPPAARRVATLALHGLDAGEIRWILGLGDAAFRQRLTSIRRALAATGLPAGAAWAAIPDAGPARSVDLQYGLVRRALRAAIERRPGLGTHDADGHLLILRPRAHTPAPGGN